MTGEDSSLYYRKIASSSCKDQCTYVRRFLTTITTNQPSSCHLSMLVGHHSIFLTTWMRRRRGAVAASILSRPKTYVAFVVVLNQNCRREDEPPKEGTKTRVIQKAADQIEDYIAACTTMATTTTSIMVNILTTILVSIKKTASSLVGTLSN